MSLTTPSPKWNVPFRFVNRPKEASFLSLKTIPFLILIAGTLPPALGAGPVVTTIPVSAPESLESIVASPTQNVVYVADELGKKIAVIDTVTNQILSFISTAKNPIGLGVSPDGNTLYVTEEPKFLEAISLPTLTQLYLVTVGRRPAIPGISSDGSTVYVPSQQKPGTVTPIGGPLVGSVIKVGGIAVDVVFNHNNTSAYVTTETKNISVINTATGSVTKIPTHETTFGLAINGTTLYATSINRVYVIDTKSNTIVDTIKVPVPTPGDDFILTLPAVTPDGAFLYVPVAEDVSTAAPNNTLVVINTKTRTVVGNPITVGELPIQVAAATNDTYGYVSNTFDGTVTVLALDHLPPF